MKIITKAKVVLILIILVMLLIIPVNVLAVTDDPMDLDGWENLEFEGDDEGVDNDEGAVTEDEEEEQPAINTNEPTTPSTNNNNESLPQAGLVEDTIMVVAIIALGTIAIYSYKKTNQYNNI